MGTFHNQALKPGQFHVSLHVKLLKNLLSINEELSDQHHLTLTLYHVFPFNVISLPEQSSVEIHARVHQEAILYLVIANETALLLNCKKENTQT